MDFKTRSNPREQILALLAIAAIFLLYLRLVAVPKREAKLQLRQQIATLLTQKEALEKFTLALSHQLSSGTEKAGTDGNPLKVLRGEQSPIATETANLLAEITAPSFLRGIQVKEMRHLPPETADGYSRANFFLEVHGSYPQLTRYLEDLENLPALMVIDDITLKGLTEKSGWLGLEINGTLFIWKEAHAAS